MSNPSNHQELLPIVVQENTVLVDARLLHRQLESRTKFTDWIKQRIEDFEFREDKDFFRNFGKSTGGRKTSEYLLTLDMAKELAMLEKSDVGRDVRSYFIEKEKEL